MSAVMNLFASNLVSSLETLKHHLDEFTDEEMMVRPVPNANHAKWQLGHVVWFENYLCSMYAPGSLVELPEDANTLYGKEGAKIDDPAKFMTKAEAISKLEKVRHGLVGWVKGMDEADLHKPAPEAFKGWVETMGDLVIGVIGHTNMHIGQFQVLRRKLGKKVLF